MSYISKNLKHIRKVHGLTQEQFAQKVGVNRPAVGAYEEGRAEPKLTTLTTIADIFQIRLDALINEDLGARSEEDLKHPDVDIKAKRLRILSVTVDGDDKENIELVPQKASAGYTNGFADPEYIQELPRLYLPMLSSGTHRAFELQGDSMLPIQSGSIVVGQYVDNWHDIKSGQTYVIVTSSEGMVYKRVDNRIYEKGHLVLISDNKAYDPYEVAIEDVIEVWEAKLWISSQMPEPPEQPAVSLDQLSEVVMNLQSEIKELKGKN